jgi:hypothetical protein
MNAKVLIAGVAVAVMATGAVSAKTTKHSTSGGAYAAPSQPIPYGQMDAYMKASPKQRAAMSASGMGTDASATTSGSSMGAGSTPDNNGMSATPAPSGSMSSGSMSSDTTAPSTGAVNPPMPETPPATPPK